MNLKIVVTAITFMLLLAPRPVAKAEVLDVICYFLQCTVNCLRGSLSSKQIKQASEPKPIKQASEPKPIRQTSRPEQVADASQERKKSRKDYLRYFLRLNKTAKDQSPEFSMGSNDLLGVRFLTEQPQNLKQFQAFMKWLKPKINLKNGKILSTGLDRLNDSRRTGKLVVFVTQVRVDKNGKIVEKTTFLPLDTTSSDDPRVPGSGFPEIGLSASFFESERYNKTPPYDVAIMHIPFVYKVNNSLCMIGIGPNLRNYLSYFKFKKDGRVLSAGEFIRVMNQVLQEQATADGRRRILSIETYTDGDKQILVENHGIEFLADGKTFKRLKNGRLSEDVNQSYLHNFGYEWIPINRK